jgi:hypothetical protein
MVQVEIVTDFLSLKRRITMNMCRSIPAENFPYRNDTFFKVRRLAPIIRKFSSRYSVPPVAVAGAIADEYNTRTGFKSMIDWFQDHILIGKMPNLFIDVDSRIGIDSKLLNATKHDLGIGNIKLETAKSVYERHKSDGSLKIKDWSEMVEYILSDEGTINIAAMVIKDAQNNLSSYVKCYSPEIKEAVYVTYYKQGPAYIYRYLSKLSKQTGRCIDPGEGCRVYYQRIEFLKALGISE